MEPPIVIEDASKLSQSCYSPHVDAAAATHLYRSLKCLADDIYETASELTGFGPYADHEIAVRTGHSIESRVTQMRTALNELLGQLRKLRSGYLSDQLHALGVDERDRQLKLHIGCGARHLDGWINMDMYPAPLSMAA